MKNKMLSILLVLAASTFANASEKSNWSVTKNVGLFAYTADFNLKEGNHSLGKVVRTGLCTPSYYYDLYDANNEFQVRGITRIFSLGLFCDRGMEIDLYEGQNVIGKIEGQFLTTSRAKFMMYDFRGRPIVEAHLDDESSNFLIVSCQDGTPVGELTGKAYGAASIWEMNYINPLLELDDRILQVFAGFVSDFQKSFIRPPKEIHHHHQHYHANKDY
jgi:hypothetical protein